MADKILIVDDDEDIRSELRDLLEGYDVLEASSGEAALGLLKRANEIGLVIMDVMMPGISGLDALTEIKKRDPGVRIVILTGHSSKDVAIEALRGHADDYIEKPLNIEKIKEVADKYLGIRGGEDNISVLDAKSKVEKVRFFVERNCFKKTTLEDAAKSVCLSPKYLSRIFKQYTGDGFSDYKLRLKINKAKDLMAKSSLNVNQVSDKLGYENTESFIRQFKKLTGKTPTAYRNKENKAKKAKAKAKRHSR